MIIDERFINWYDNQDEDMQKSVINFVIYTSATLKLKDRMKVAIEIILGKKFCLWVSRNQR
jgi:hypothetical protein